MALSLGPGRRAAAAPLAICGFSGFLPEVDGWELDRHAPLPPVALGHGRWTR